MKEVDIVSKIVNREGGTFVPSSKGTQSIDLSDYLLKSIWDKVFEIRTDSQGIEYIFGKLPMVTQYGITMYSGDGVDIPSIASGLPFDGRTIWYNPETNQIEVIGGTGGGSGEGVSNFWDLSGIPSWITNSKPKYTYSEIEGTPDLTKYALASQIPSLSGYATESWVTKQNYATKATTLSGYGITDAYTKTNVDDLLKSYVTLGGTQTITGEKNFTGGLKVNGSPIYYDTEKKHWKLEGDLLVTGGVTMYGSDSSFTPSTIMDAIAVDGTTISKSGGVLKVIGGTGGGVADSVAWANITGKPTWIGSSKPTYSYSEITGAISTTELQNYLTQNSYLNVTSGDNRYLKLSGGTLTDGLTISAGNLIVSGSDTVTNSLYPTKDNQYTLGNSSRYWSDIYTKLINGGTPWTSVNDGSGSGLDADLLDGKQPSELNVGSADVLAKSYSENINYGTYHSALKLIYNTQNDNYGFPNLYVSGLSVMAGYTGWQLMSYGGDVENPYFRSLQDNGNWKPWRKLAFIDDNVASATKLQTARTIWGQSFDGTGNVSGELVLGSSYITGFQGINILDAKSSWVILGEGTNAKSWTTYINGYNINFRCGSDGTSGLYIDSKDRVGIGTTSPAKKLHIYDSNISNDSILLLEKGNAHDSRLELTNSVDSFSITQQSNGNAYISLRGNHSLIFETSNSSRLTIDSLGNVGIGITSPAYKLDVNGTISVNSSDAISLKLNSSKTDWGFAYNSIGIYHSNSQKGGFGWNSEPAGLSNVGFYFKNYVSGDCISLFNEGGICFIGSNVGIGTASPTYKLDVKGEIRMSGAGIIGGGLYFTGIGSGTYNKGTIMSTTTYGYEIEAPRATDSATGTALPIFIGWRGGALGIKITSGGNLLANGGITMYSDQRKKTILNHVELSLKDIANAPLIEHYYNSDEKKTTHVGSIAQYWAEMNDWFCKLDSEGYYTMEIQNAALASAISIARELDRYETKTDKAIKKLKKRICELEEELERLKAS